MLQSAQRISVVEDLDRSKFTQALSAVFNFLSLGSLIFLVLLLGPHMNL